MITIERTIDYCVTTNEISPIKMQYGGVQGDDNISQLKFDITDIHSEDVYLKYRIEYTTGSGVFGSSEHLTVYSETINSEVIYYVKFAITKDITISGGIAQLHLLQIKVDENNLEEKIYYSFPASVYFVESTIDNPQYDNYKSGLTGLMLETEQIKQDAKDICEDFSNKASQYDGKILLKVDKYQGTENNGKNLTVGEDGNVTLVTPPSIVESISMDCSDNSVPSARAVFDTTEVLSQKYNALIDTLKVVSETNGQLADSVANKITTQNIKAGEGIEITTDSDAYIGINSEMLGTINGNTTNIANALSLANTNSSRISSLVTDVDYLDSEVRSKIDSVETKQNFSQALKNKVSGKSVVINDVSSLNHNMIVTGDANSVVQVYGLNLLPSKYELNCGTQYGVTLTKNEDCSYAITGALTEECLLSGTVFTGTQRTSFSAGTYYIKKCSDCSIVLGYFIGDAVENTVIIEQGDGIQQFVLEEDCYLSYINLWFSEMDVEFNSTFYPQVSLVDGEYEKYIDPATKTIGQDGTALVASKDSTMTFMSDNVINIEYNQDINKVINALKTALIASA